MNITKVLKYSLGLIFILFFHFNSFSSDILFSSLGIKEGLSHLSVYSIHQDETGALWFGTRQGLNHFDGIRLKHVRINPEPEDLVDFTIWSIAGDNNGSLYLLADKNLIRYDLENQKFETLTKGNIDGFFYQNHQPYIVISDEIFHFNPETREKTFFAKLEASQLPVKRIIHGSQGVVWIATNSGLIKCNTDGNVENTYFKNKQITALFEDSHKSLWIGTRENGAYRFNPHNETTISMLTEISNNEVRSFQEDENGEIWIGTFQGLFRVNLKTGARTKYEPSEGVPHSLSHSSVYAIYKDVQGTMWVGTYFGGISYFNPVRDIYKYYPSHNSQTNFLSYPIIGNMTEDDKGNLWICTEGGGLNKLNRKTGKVAVFKHDDTANSIAQNNIKSIYFDKNHNKLYIGTHLGGLSVYDISENTFANFTTNANQKQSISNNVVNRMAKYKDELLLATQYGISSVNLKTGEVSPDFNLIGNDKRIPKRLIWDIHVDKKDRLWIAYFTSDLIRIDLKTGDLKNYNYSLTPESDIPRYRITEIFEDLSGNMFFASDGAGIITYDEENDKFIIYASEATGLLSDFCFRVTETPSGNLIALTHNGFSIINKSNQSIRNFQASIATPLTGVIEENNIYIANNHEIFIGGINGMISFFEDDLRQEPEKYNIYFSNLFVNNKEVIPGDDTEILSRSLAYTDSITLKHNQGNAIFEFSVSNYLRFSNQIFEYKLEGHDNDWAEIQGTAITYTNIPPGSYILKVREKDVPVNEAALFIDLSPAWYKSNLAYYLYSFLLIVIIVSIILFDRYRTYLKTSLNFERKEKERIEELNQSKLRFFTNISHEFRTFLTLIINQTEVIAQHAGLPHTISKHVARIQKNAARMRNLVNELLDFRKQEDGQLKLKVSSNNLIDFLNDIYISFEDYAFTKNIRFSFENPGGKLEVWYDLIQLQKVFFNLLSNAFKFTGEGDSIKIRLIPKNSSVVIKITDTSKGIPADELNHIFDHFYQAENISSDSGLLAGSGIGLALSKGIIELHGGNISVESREGEGTTFRVELLLGEDHFTSDQKLTSPERQKVSFTADFYSDETIKKSMAELQNNDNKPTVLIVEDNEDTAQLLRDIFTPVYKAIVAVNGMEGYEKAIEYQPDIVVTDVRMPKMSGKELCRKIKSNYSLSHIPVILLTSQTSEEEISEGFLDGADDYIIKPFDAKSLMIRCNNLINSRRVLQEKFSKTTAHPQLNLATNAAHEEFISNIDRIIDKNLDKINFNIDKLAKELGMGRSKLYSSVKEITGTTPNTYIMNYKMLKAAEWLKKHPHLNISEISVKLGFNTPQYFSICFKDHYGMPPNEFRKSFQEKDTKPVEDPNLADIDLSNELFLKDNH